MVACPLLSIKRNNIQNFDRNNDLWHNLVVNKVFEKQEL